MSDVIVLRIPVHLLHDLLHKAEVALGDAPKSEAHSPGPRLEPERAWTDRQRHLLFRLVYRLGHEGTEARRFINTQIGLNAGQEPTVKQASRLIDQLMSAGEQHGAA